MRGRNVDAQTKAAAVGIALMSSSEEASRQTGIPGRTIRQWVESPEFAALRHTPREEVGETMWVAVQEAVHALREGIANPKAYLRDKVAAFEALVEKRALIMGEATSRAEITSLTDDLPADTKRALRERLARAVRGESEPVGADGVPEGAGSGLGGNTAGQAGTA